ncbi:MAG TPA: hypothetical protein VEZ12_24380 [Herpetosiphonaceae bacterium]|nr:hypothetical protein [Herpetosiphonaceae bacterium]
MTQKPSRPSRPGQRPATAADDDDLNALLDSIMADDPGPRHHAMAPTGGGARPRAEQRVEEQQARQLELVSNELQAQLRVIANQVQSLSEASATQAEQGRAIQELRQTLRQVILATQRQPQGQQPATMFNAELQLPSLQIKLVLAQAANLLHQADKEVTVLGNWSMFFAGVGTGTLLSLMSSVLGPYTTRFWIYLAIAAFALLTWQARRRVVRARRAMEESTLTRSVPIGS